MVFTENLTGVDSVAIFFFENLSGVASEGAVKPL